MDSTRLQCLLASLCFYVLAALKFWPVGLLTAVVPAVFVWLGTKRCLDSVRDLDQFVDTFMRRGGR